MSSYSSGIRVFRGCRALLAPAKSSAAAAANVSHTKTNTTTAAATTAKPKTTKAKAKAKPRSSSPGPKREGVSRPTGILKVGPISPALQSFLGAPEASRTDAVKQIWSYVKLHNLQNPADKREIYCDEKLKALFDKDKVGFLEIGKLLTRHFVKTA